MACYRSGGCGPYEMMSCSECPASKPEYCAAAPSRSIKERAMAEYIEREAVHRMMVGLTRYRWTSPVSTESRATVDADDVNFGVDKIPAADVAPVVHGRWEERKRPTEHLVCSACCRKNFMRVKSEYCPNCGAKMDAELLKGGEG